MPGRFAFPHPVNETSARLVATGVVLMSAALLVSGSGWLLVPLIYGFLARVTTGPTLSPLGLIATKVITPRIRRQHRFVAGPPKRFAQFVGLLFSASAGALWVADYVVAAKWVIAALLLAAALEAFLAICLGCIVFGWLMRLGLVPDEVCEECNSLPSVLANRK